MGPNLICSPCLDYLAGVPDNYFDIIATSPPYTASTGVGARRYHGFPPLKFDLVSKEVARTLKRQGVYLHIEGDVRRGYADSGLSYRHFINLQDAGLGLSSWVYAKGGLPFPPPRKFGLSRSFENIFVGIKPDADGRPIPRYWNRKAALIKPNSQAGKFCRGRTRKHELGDELVFNGRTFHINEFGVASDVLKFQVGKNHSCKDKLAVGHSGVAPFRLMFFLLSLFLPADLNTRKNIRLYDPYLGSGQSLLAGLGLGLSPENLYGTDVSQKYIDEIARPRLTDPEVLRVNMEGFGLNTPK